MDIIKRAHNINSLFLAKLGKTKITNGEDDSLFILEHKLVDLFNSGKVYSETYTDVVKDFEIVNRTIQEDMSIPEEIRELMPFPVEYLTEEEIVYGMVSDIRIYEIYREINFNRTRQQPLK